jgi:hypothetical protein
LGAPTKGKQKKGLSVLLAAVMMAVMMFAVAGPVSAMGLHTGGG